MYGYKHFNSILKCRLRRNNFVLTKRFSSTLYDDSFKLSKLLIPTVIILSIPVIGEYYLKNNTHFFNKMKRFPRILNYIEKMNNKLGITIDPSKPLLLRHDIETPLTSFTPLEPFDINNENNNRKSQDDVAIIDTSTLDDNDNKENTDNIESIEQIVINEDKNNSEIIIPTYDLSIIDNNQKSIQDKLKDLKEQFNVSGVKEIDNLTSQFQLIIGQTLKESNKEIQRILIDHFQTGKISDLDKMSDNDLIQLIKCLKEQMMMRNELEVIRLQSYINSNITSYINNINNILHNENEKLVDFKRKYLTEYANTLKERLDDELKTLKDQELKNHQLAILAYIDLVERRTNRQFEVDKETKILEWTSAIDSMKQDKFNHLVLYYNNLMNDIKSRNEKLMAYENLINKQKTEISSINSIENSTFLLFKIYDYLHNNKFDEVNELISKLRSIDRDNPLLNLLTNDNIVCIKTNTNIYETDYIDRILSDYYKTSPKMTGVLAGRLLNKLFIKSKTNVNEEREVKLIYNKLVSVRNLALEHKFNESLDLLDSIPVNNCSYLLDYKSIIEQLFTKHIILDVLSAYIESINKMI